MKKFYAAIIILLGTMGAYAQQTKPAMQAEISANLPDQTVGQITPALMRQTLNDMVLSYQQNVIAQTISTTTYTVVTADNGKAIVFGNASPIAVALPTPTSVGNGFNFYGVVPAGGGAATFTPVGGVIFDQTLNGGAGYTLAAGTAAQFISDGAGVWRVTLYGGGAGGGGVSSVANSDSTLSILPTSGAVIASLNLAHANTWTATQTIFAAALSNVTGITSQCIHANSAGVLSGTGVDCGSGGGGGGVSSVANTDGSITISPNTGAVVANLNTGNANTWTGRQTFTVPLTGLTISPTNASLNQGLLVNQGPSGTSSGNCSGCVSSGIYAANQVWVSSDQVSATTGATALAISMNSGGGNTFGERAALYTSNQLTAADAALNPFPYYISMVNEVKSTVNDRGTNTGAGRRGQLYAWNPRVLLENGATNYDIIAIAELDIEANTGSSVATKYGLLTVLQPGDNVHAATREFSYGVGNAGPLGWNKGFVASDIYGSPIATTGTYIGTDLSTTRTIAYGIDLRGFTMTTAAFRSPNFIINGNGDVLGTSFGTAAHGGITCAAGTVSAASIAIDHGIVYAAC